MTDVVVFFSGVQASAFVGQALVYADIVPDQNPGYSPESPSQVPGWSEDTVSQTPNWNWVAA